MDAIQIWIDADSCPALVRNHVIKTANKKNLDVFLVANKVIPTPPDLIHKMIVTGSEKDAADNYIFENVKENDLVITRDIVFADRLVEKEITCINDRGTVFKQDNIKQLLSSRDFDLTLYNLGLVKHFNEGYDKEKFTKFANAFDKSLTKLLRRFI